MKWYNELFKKGVQGVGSPTATLGVGSAQVFGGYINSNEKSAKLRGQQKYITYSDMLANTSIVAAGTRLFLNLISKAEWKWESPDDNNAEIEDKLDMIKDKCNTPWYRVVRRTAMFRFYGFGFQEWTAKVLKDGTVGYLDVQPRPQFTIERWNLDFATGLVESIVQRSPQDGREILLPRQKLIYAVDDSISDSPEGLGIFRHIIDSAKRLADYEKLEGVGFETDLRGVPIGRMPLQRLQQQVNIGNLTKEDMATYKTAMESFLQNHVKGIQTSLLLDSSVYTSSDEAESPSGSKMYDMELLQGSSNSQDAVAKSIERLNYEIARVLGAEGLLVGSGSTGTQALSKDKSTNLYLLVDSTLKELGEIYEKDYLDPLFMMNGWDEDKKPKMKTESIQFRDVEQITAALRDMSTAGAVLAPDDPAINELRDLIGLSHAPDPLPMTGLDPLDPNVNLDEDVGNAMVQHSQKVIDKINRRKK